MAAATATVAAVMVACWVALTVTAPVTLTSESRMRARRVVRSASLPMALRTIATPIATPTAAPSPPVETATAAARAPVPARMMERSVALTVTVVAAFAPPMELRTTSAWVWPVIALLLPAPPPARATPKFWAQATATEAATADDTISACRSADTRSVPVTRALLSSSRASVSADT